MRRTLALAALCVAALAGTAQAAPNNNNSEKLRAAVTLGELKTHLANFQAIADEAGGNRFAGLEGHDMSAEYVVEQLEAAGYSPTLQAFEYDAFFERTPSQLHRVTDPATTFVNGVDFRVLSYSGSGDVTAPLALPGGAATGCFAADYAGFPAGSIALVQRGTPAGFPNNGGVCTFRLKLDLARAAGASGILVYNNVDGVVNGTLGATGLSQIPGLGLTKALGEALRAEMAGNSIVFRMVTNTATERLTTSNVLAETPGDPANVVMVGAHLDSVTAGPGINDNGSGSAAILQTAIEMAGVKPRNKVRFAWWSAEESGLIGSTYYVAQLSQAQRDAIALYLNFDMVASPNFGRFVYDGDNSTGTAPTGTNTPPGSDLIERVFYGYFESVGLPAEPTPFNGRSDYGPFIAAAVNIPAGGLFTGAEVPKTAEQVLKYGGTAGIAFDPCYHAACDTFANISDTAFDTNADAIAHATITFAQNTELINGIRGKGNFKRPQQGANDGTGTGGGGGLHDHDHEGEES